MAESLAEVRPTVSLVSLGCSKNQVDSERMLSGFLQCGFRYHTDSREADLVVINTCGFIGPAKEQSIDTVLSYGALKNERPGMKLAVAGCLFERYGETLQKEFPEVDYWVEGSPQAALDAIAEQEMGPIRHPNQTLGPRSILLNDPGMAYLRTSQGCDRKCSFCSIPGFKGKQVSVPVEQLVAEANQLVEEQGVHELILNAQDLCRYGTDIGYKPGLAGLLEELLAGTSAQWIRFLYAYPFSLQDRCLELMASEDRLVPYLDMPFQHADSGVLRKMRRGHGGEKFLDYMAGIREAVPGLVCRSTMLVGHPGETEEAFEVLCDFVQRAKFEWMGVFEYSDEDETHAETLENKIEPELISARAQQVREIFEDVRSVEAFGLGKEQDALVGSVDGSMLVTRLATQAPEVDGVTFVPDPGGIEPGSMIRVIPEDELGFDLSGRIVGKELSV